MWSKDNTISSYLFYLKLLIQFYIKDLQKISLKSFFFDFLIEKLGDILQELESTSFKYFKVSFNYIEQFSRSISVYLTLSRVILVYFGLF